jgi:hypothetical protein
MNAPKKELKPHGQLRRSQVVTTFGPGAMMDLPTCSIMIGGLESWGDPVALGFTSIQEERLLQKVRETLERPDLTMYSPPIDLALNDTTKRGITGWLFPEWFVVQHDETDSVDVRSRRLVHRKSVQRGRAYGGDKKRYPVVPVRFVRACPAGHIGDIDWYRFVHGNEDQCRQQLYLDERAASGEFADIFVRCECKKSRPFAQARPGSEVPAPLGYCDGARPWLGNFGSKEKCGGEEGPQHANRLLVRSASNAYFPQILSVIHIPPSNAKLKKSVDEVWNDFLQYAEEEKDVAKERKKAKVSSALEGLSDKEVYKEIERRKSGAPTPAKSIKQAEIETFIQQVEGIGDDAPEGDFYATAVKLSPKRTGFMAKIDRVVLVHRLLEVTAQIGFTRFEPELPDIDGELSLDVRRAALSIEGTWVPAVETRGEGFLLGFDPALLDAWVARPEVKKRVATLEAGFAAHARHNPKSKMTFPGPRYVLLHSLSHLLISAVSLACGYAASSIRERIYVTDGGCGILLYTGTSDSEGTLGGLVEVGRNFEEHLRAALEMGGLCSNDPVCAQHRSHDRHTERFLHGAACHGCVLIAEPSCERRNDFLDRALVIPTVEDLGAEFFTEDDL